MVRIAVVEDDRGYAEKLRKYLERYQEESKNKLSIAYFQDGEDIALEYRGGFDIILMDIEMQFMNGMTAAEKIRELDDEVVIMFITNTPQYAMKGYMVNALDYVMKPLSYFAFSQKLDRALARMERRRKKYIPISIKGGMKKIEVSGIYYVEVRDHDLIFHTAEGDYETKGAMREVEASLGEEHFFRCNKCYLVNLEHVGGIQGNDLLVGREMIQVSRSRKKELLNRLNDYMNEVSQ